MRKSRSLVSGLNSPPAAEANRSSRSTWYRRHSSATSPLCSTERDSTAYPQVTIRFFTRSDYPISSHPAPASRSGGTVARVIPPSAESRQRIHGLGSRVTKVRLADTNPPKAASGSPQGCCGWIHSSGADSRTALRPGCSPIPQVAQSLVQCRAVLRHQAEGPERLKLGGCVANDVTDTVEQRSKLSGAHQV